jgi:hypothetical protein
VVYDMPWCSKCAVGNTGQLICRTSGRQHVHILQTLASTKTWS